MSPSNASVKKKLKRKKPNAVHCKKRVVSSQEHSYLKTVLSQCRVTNMSQKKKMEKLLENNKSLAQALEAAEISRQQQEQIILSLQRQLTLTNPAVIKRNLKEMGMYIQKVVNLMADTLEYVIPGDEDEMDEQEDHTEPDVPLLPTNDTSNNVCPDPVQRNLHNDLREKFGVCDLTVINEDTLRLQEMSLPPILFTDGEDNSSSLRNSKRNSSRHKSSRKGRSTPSLSRHSSSAELNDSVRNSRIKSGNGIPAVEEFPQLRSENDTSVRVSQHNVLKTPSPKVDARNKLLSLETSDDQTPKTPVFSPFLNLDAKQIAKSSIPRPIKDTLKKKTLSDDDGLCTNLSSIPKQFRGTVVLGSDSQNCVNNAPEKVPNETMMVSGATTCTVTDLATYETSCAGKAQHSEVLFPRAAQTVFPSKEVIPNYFDDMQENNCIQPGGEEITVNLSQDMEFTYPVGKFLVSPEKQAVRPEKLVEPSVDNVGEMPCNSDENSDLTEIYNSQANSNMISQTAKSGLKPKEGTPEIPKSSQISDSTKLGSQSKKQTSGPPVVDLVDNGSDEMTDATEIYNVKSYCNASSSGTKQGTDKEFPASFSGSKPKETSASVVSNRKNQLAMSDSASSRKDHEVELGTENSVTKAAELDVGVHTVVADIPEECEHQQPSEEVATKASKSKGNTSLAKSSPNSSENLKPANRRGTFVMPHKPEEQGVDSQSRHKQLREVATRTSKSKENMSVRKTATSPSNSDTHLQPVDRRGTFVVPHKPEEQSVDSQSGHKQQSEGVAARTSKSKGNMSLTKTATSPSNSGAHLQPGDRRVTFVVPHKPEEQDVDSQHGPSGISPQSKRRNAVTPSDAVKKLQNSQPDQDLRSEPKSPCDKNSPYRFPEKGCSPVSHKSTGKVSKPSKKSPGSSRSCVLGRKKLHLSQFASHKSNSKKKKEPTFKFFSKKNSAVLQSAEERKIDEQNPVVPDIIASESNGDQVVGKSFDKPVGDETSDAFCVSQKTQSSSSPKYPKSLQKVMDVSNKTKAASSSKPTKRKSVSKDSRESKKAKLDIQNQTEDCMTNAPDTITHEKGQSRRLSSLRSQHKRKSVSFKMPSERDIHLFNHNESICLPPETDHSVAQEEEIKQEDRETENVAKSSPVAIQSENTTSDQKECGKSFVVLVKDIFQVNVNSTSVSNKQTDVIQASSGVSTDGSLQPASNISRSPVKDSPQRAKSLKHDNKNERRVASSNMVSEKQVCELTEPSSDKGSSKPESTQAHVSNKDPPSPKNAVAPRRTKKSTRKADNDEKFPTAKSALGKLPKDVISSDVQKCAGGDNSMTEVTPSSTEKTTSSVKDKPVKTTKKKLDEKGDTGKEGNVADSKVASQKLNMSESSECSSDKEKGKKSSKSDITHKGTTSGHSSKASSDYKKAKISHRSTKSGHKDAHNVYRDEACNDSSILSSVFTENERNVALRDNAETSFGQLEKRLSSVECDEDNAGSKSSSTKSSEDETKSKKISKRISKPCNAGNDIQTESRKENVPDLFRVSEIGRISMDPEDLGTERESSGRTRRRTGVISYKEPSLGTKLRRGDMYFSQKQ